MARSQLKYGSNGNEVKELQKILNQSGYKLTEDGIFGQNTQNAVKDYQTKNGLTVDGIVGDNTWSSLSKNATPKTSPTTTASGFTYGNYQESDAVVQAKNALNAQLAQKPGEYSSPWQNQLDEVMNKILNREEFSFDLNGDALYQQLKDRHTQQAKMAMSDAIGQASALTGGYGNSYAQGVGQQYYNAEMQNLNNMIPELYQMAYDRYAQKGQDLYNQYAMLGAQEERDYGRHQNDVAAWQAERDYLAARYDNERNLDHSKYIDERNFAYNDHRSAIADQQWQDSFEYQQERDQIADQQWQDSFDYQKGRAIADQQWQDSFEYQQERDQIADQQWQDSFDYQKGRDQVSDQQWQDSFDYQQNRDQVADQQWQDTFDYQQGRDQVADQQWQDSFEYQQGRDQVADQQWEDSFEYQQGRDQVADQQWQDSFNHQQSQDQIANQQWQDSFDYQKERDQAADQQWQDSFEYQQGRDQVADQQWQDAFDYQQNRDQVSDQQWQDSFEYQQGRDQVADNQWQSAFDYQKGQDNIDNQYRQDAFDWEKSEAALDRDERNAANFLESEGKIGYDNGSVSADSIKRMQKALGIEANGKWGSGSKEASGGLTADQAWKAYKDGKLGKADASFADIEADCAYFSSQNADASEIDGYLYNAFDSGYITEAEYKRLKEKYGSKTQPQQTTTKPPYNTGYTGGGGGSSKLEVMLK